MELRYEIIVKSSHLDLSKKENKDLVALRLFNCEVKLNRIGKLRFHIFVIPQDPYEPLHRLHKKPKKHYGKE